VKNRLIGNFAFKTLCVVLALICSIVSAVGFIAMFFMYQWGFWEYDIETVKKNTLSSYMYQDMLASLEEAGFYTDSLRNNFFYRDVKTNFYFEVQNTKTEEILQSNIDNDAIRGDFGYVISENYDNLVMSDDMITFDTEWALANENGEISKSVPPEYDEGNYSEITDKYDLSVTYEVVDVSNGEVHYRVMLSNVTVTGYLLKQLKIGDRFYYTDLIINSLYPNRTLVLVITFFCFLAFIMLMITLCCSAGVYTDGESPRLSRANRFPFDTATLILAIIGFAEAVLLSNVLPSSTVGDLELKILMVFSLSTVDMLFIILYIMSFAARIKTGKLFSGMLTVRFFKFLGRKIVSFYKRIFYGFRNLKFVKKTVVSIIIILLVNLLICILNGFSAKCAYVLALVQLCIYVPLVISLAIQFRKIEEGVKKIVSGDFSFKIDTKYMFGDFKRMAQELNGINVGMQKAVDEKMKSERFKTELITNVSHDLKTPLTSIINYVDLIKKEDVENETVVNYIDVLDRQSSRLKKLIEDLIEASKASTGNIQVNFAPCDAGILLSQAVAEYYEKAENAHLEFIVNADDSSHFILADNRLLWRVYDNLLSNICKYAFPGTRVYLSVRTVGDSVVTVFKNISRAKLNISSDELMERFVRGDSSRNTEGSGLGLSIVRSLTTLQHGAFDVSIDGDMYTASVTFGLLKQADGGVYEIEKNVEEN